MCADILTFCIWALESSKKGTQWEMSHKNIGFWLLLTHGGLGNYSVHLTHEDQQMPKSGHRFRWDRSIAI